MSSPKFNYNMLRAIAGVALLVTMSACMVPMEWSTDSQGQLQSVGLPGLPLWQSQQLAQQKAMAQRGSLAAAPGAVADAAAAKIPAYGSDADWLAEINRWRSATGTAPIGENPALSEASIKHAEYLVKNGPSSARAFSQYAAALGGAAHTEDPGNPYFTQAGYDAAQGGAADVNWSLCSATDGIDNWVQVPFHRLSILAPWMRVVGYGEYGHCPISAANLTIRGAAPVGLTQAVVFPPDGAMVNGKMDSGEWPDPLDACQGYSYPVGTPITMQLGSFVRVSLTSYALEDETTGRAVEACGFDALTYPGEHGRQTLTNFGAVVVIPRHPLTPGHSYQVTIRTHRHTKTWSFRVGKDLERRTLTVNQTVERIGRGEDSKLMLMQPKAAR